MSRTRRPGITIAAAGVLAAGALAVTVWLSETSSAQSGYTDPRATGTITLYDAAGHTITSGSVHDQPFVARAVASTRAPAPYDQPGAKATLLAYQPREDTVSSAWSGDTLTGATAFPDPAHPAVVASATDFTLQDFLDEFPARWDGQIQLRIYLSAPNEPTLNDRYAAADLVVTGDTWRIADAPTDNDGATAVSPMIVAASPAGFGPVWRRPSGDRP